MESSCQVKNFYDTLNDLSILIEKLKDQAKNIISNSSSNHSNSSSKTSCEETKTDEKSYKNNLNFHTYKEISKEPSLLIVNNLLSNNMCTGSFSKQKIDEIKNEKKEEIITFPLEHNSYNKDSSFLKNCEIILEDLLEVNKDLVDPEYESIFGNAQTAKFVKKHFDIPYNIDKYNSFPPLLRNVDFKIRDMQCYFLINNKCNDTLVTLHDASKYPYYYNKKEIIIRNLHNHAVLSSSNDIQQLDSNEVSNCILPKNSDGKYVVLTTNGKNWVIKRIF
jgi:hypothetical protein